MNAVQFMKQINRKQTKPHFDRGRSWALSPMTSGFIIFGRFEMSQPEPGNFIVNRDN